MMVSELQSEIRENLQKYIDGASLSEFEDWFMPLLWDLSDSADCEPKRLAGTIANLIAEYSCGHLNQTDLRKELAAAIRPFERREVVALPQRFFGGWKAENGTASVPFGYVVVDTRTGSPQKIPVQSEWVVSTGSNSNSVPAYLAHSANSTIQTLVAGQPRT
jgi:hypothetical protein